eukprot:scaffold23672_cov186-Cylindrotheca_fusiformis.AAC.1
MAWSLLKVTTHPWSVKVPTDRRAWLARFGNMWPVFADAGRGSRPGRVQVWVETMSRPSGRRTRMPEDVG